MLVASLVVAAATYVAAGNFFGASEKKTGMGTFFPSLRLLLGADLGEGRYVLLKIDANGPKTAEKIIKTLRRRTEELGIPEPNAFPLGDDRLLLFVPSHVDAERAMRVATVSAALSFHEAQTPKGRAPAQGYVRLPYVTQEKKSEIDVKKAPLIGERRLDGAKSGIDRQGRPAVTIRFDRLGAKRLFEATSLSSNTRVAALLDGAVLAVSDVSSPIRDGRIEISGAFDKKSADELALLLRAGSLSNPIKIEETKRVGTFVGDDAATKIAIGLGAAFVATGIWLGWAYLAFGAVAALALAVNAVMTAAAMALLGAPLTLPGVMGLTLAALTSLSAHIFMVERVRDERRAGKKWPSAIRDGVDEAGPTVIDASVAVLIATAALHGFGPEFMKSFAAPLSLGVLSHVFTAVILIPPLLLVALRDKGASRNI